MNITDLQKKSDAELIAYVKEKREELRKLRFGVTGSGMRNTHAIRDIRRELAQALTVVSTRRASII
jgi:ribosomal protein L29